MLDNVEWGDFNLEKLFGNATRGKRLKSSDRIEGPLPFVTAGEANEGVSSFIANDVTVFQENTTTIDMFGSAKYRSYKYGADDHVAVVHTENLSRPAAIFVTAAIHKSSYTGAFDYGRNFYAKDADQLNISLPSLKGTKAPNYECMERLIDEVEVGLLTELEGYLSRNKLIDYHLTHEEKEVIENYDAQEFAKFNIIDVFTVKNTANILSRDIKENSGDVPYLCASREHNSVSSYITYDSKYLESGNCVFIGGKTFVVTYQEKDFFSNDSHNLALYFKGKKNKLNQLFFVTCIERSLGHKYSWGDSISNRKIQEDIVLLPVKNGGPDLLLMETLVSAVQKIVIKDVVHYVESKMAAANQVQKNKLTI
ncbi:restriction endonuclease subunit S [Pantoea ananatis]|uniref:restriction endonuclease subunit S n=1 Tax=Pantoea ananas TaxID=553 RepID=UPI001FF0A1AC|nr:restriction endonuclease subunit S [Pantoea ananatis]MCW1834590.1 restriction endonuclease subunit S [Pantoea ananatis]